MEDNKIPNIPIWSKIIITCVLSLLAGAFLLAVFIFSGLSPDFLTDGQCEELNNESFINGTYYGNQITLFNIMNTTINCKQTYKIQVNDQTYNLQLVECLDLNENQEENQNG